MNHNQNPYLNLYTSQQPMSQQPVQNWSAQQAPQPQQMPQSPQGSGSYSVQGQSMRSSNNRYPQNSGLLGDRFFKGLLIGAAAAYILTNESVQRAAIKGAVRAWSLLQGGAEEIKERFHDAEAELRAESGE